MQEFVGRFNLREQDTFDLTGVVVLGMYGKRLNLADLIKDNGLASGAHG